MEQNKKPIGYEFDTPEEKGQVIITLKSGVQVKAAPQSLEDARGSAEGFQIMNEDYERGASPAIVKNTNDLFINVTEIAAIEVRDLTPLD